MAEPEFRTLKVFLCHGKEDKAKVRELYKKLLQAGVQPWLDEEALTGGETWDLVITKAVRESDIVLVCLSPPTVSKTGFVQMEIKLALDQADRQPEGTIYIIPLILEECDVPTRLSRWQWVKYYEESGYDRLIRALQARASQLGISIASFRLADAGIKEFIEKASTFDSGAPASQINKLGSAVVYTSFCKIGPIC
jgi:hypothetical protein